MKIVRIEAGNYAVYMRIPKRELIRRVSSMTWAGDMGRRRSDRLYTKRTTTVYGDPSSKNGASIHVGVLKVGVR